jgi:MSHA biogenesis protein MshL
MSSRGSHLGIGAAGLAVLAVIHGCATARAQQAGSGPPLPSPLAVSRLADPQSPAGVPAPAHVSQQASQPSGQKPLPPLPVTRLEERLREEYLDAGRTFSLRLNDPVPVKEVLLLLVRDTRFSIVASAGVEGAFVGELKDVTLKQALDLVLHPLDLDYLVDDTFIRVFPRRLETRRFDVNYVLTSRSTERSVGGPAGDRGSAPVRVSSVDHADLYAELAAGMTTLLSSDGRFNLDRKAALLQVTDYPDRLDQVRLYVEAVEQRATRQVAIQAWLVEVALDASHAAGLDWSAVTGRSSGGVTVTEISAQALLSALAAQGAVNVLATPRVSAMNNEPAVMRADGITLTVTPQIAVDGFVQMSITPSVTDGDAAPAGAGAPRAGVREADTFVRVRGGETVVISGLMRQRGAARTDLVVLLTPTLVIPGGAAAEAVQR